MFIHLSISIPIPISRSIVSKGWYSRIGGIE